MILFAEKRHENEIAALWNEAFGDSEQEVLKYLGVILKYIAVFEEQGRVCGMLSLLPVKMEEKRGRYIYAVATLKEHRGRGISTNLLDFAKNEMRKNGEEFLVLVPQEESLFDFYGKRGFKSISCTGCAVIEQNFTKEGFSAEKISAEQYYFSRKKYFSRLIEWDDEMLEFAADMYRGDFYSVKCDKVEIGTAFCFADEDILYVKEVCGENVQAVVKTLGVKYSKKFIKYNFADFNAKSSAMMCPKAAEGVYFGIAMD